MKQISLLSLKKHFNCRNLVESFNKIQKRSIITYTNKNYSEPNTNDEIVEVKNWLNNLKPKYLCIYYTNTWNPVAIKSQNDYYKFTGKTSMFTNLRIDTDKYPRLKWFFDMRTDPGFQFYYYGNLLNKFGGTNFEAAISEIQRIQDNIESSNDSENYRQLNNSNVSYEMPYYEYERQIENIGNFKVSDYGQSTLVQSFIPQFFNIKDFPFEEKWAVNNRLKK